MEWRSGGAAEAKARRRGGVRKMAEKRENLGMLECVKGERAEGINLNERPPRNYRARSVCSRDPPQPFLGKILTPLR